MSSTRVSCYKIDMEIKLTAVFRKFPEGYAAFVEELPEVFVPIAGGWGRMGMTHIRLAIASEDVLAGALRHGSYGLRRMQGQVRRPALWRKGRGGRRSAARSDDQCPSIETMSTHVS